MSSASGREGDGVDWDYALSAGCWKREILMESGNAAW